MQIYKSRFTPGLKNGEDVKFEIGEKVKYRTRAGEDFVITIASERMRHYPSGLLGYEAIFPDDGQKYFAAGKGIYDWDGKDSWNSSQYIAQKHGKVNG